MFKKVQFFLCDRQLYVWGALQVSTHLNIWATLSKKDKFSICKKVYCSHTVLTRLVFFFAESCSDVQISWNLERTSRIQLSITHKKKSYFFLTGCRWAWAPNWVFGQLEDIIGTTIAINKKDHRIIYTKVNRSPFLRRIITFNLKISACIEL